jgi:hypothetical protein
MQSRPPECPDRFARFSIDPTGVKLGVKASSEVGPNGRIAPSDFFGSWLTEEFTDVPAATI